MIKNIVILFMLVGIIQNSLIRITLAADAPSMEAETKEGSNPAKNKYKRSKLTSDESELVADRRSLVLTPGEDRTVDLDFDANGGTGGIVSGNPSVVITSLVSFKSGRRPQLVFKPLKQGESTVTVRDADGSLRLVFDVQVKATNLSRIAGEIRNLLRDVEGLEIRIVGQKVVLDGEILVPSDYGRIYAVTQEKVYADNVLNLAVLSPFALQMIAKKMQDDISLFAQDVKVRVVNGVIFLDGTVESADLATRAVNIAKSYLPEVRPSNPLERDATAKALPNRQMISSNIMVKARPPKKQEKLVRVTVHFVELDKDYSKLFGFKWQPGFTADPSITIGQTQQGGAGASSGPSFSATLSSLIPKLNSAQTAGYARVLKTGTIVVRSGLPATLTESTEFPFAQAGQNGQQSYGSKGVGLTLAVTPQILGQSEDIELTLDLDQTSLVGRAPATGAPPVTAKHTVKTKLYVKSNESAAVAGLASTDIGTDFNKDDPLPGGFDSSGGTQALFSLLHSKAYRKKKSQFVIFVTPQIIENASDGTEDLKKNFRVKVK